MVQLDRSQYNMAQAHCMLHTLGYKHTHTHKHTQCVICTAFPLQQWLHERDLILRVTVHCLFTCRYLQTSASHNATLSIRPWLLFSHIIRNLVLIMSQRFDIPWVTLFVGTRTTNTVLESTQWTVYIASTILWGRQSLYRSFATSPRPTVHTNLQYNKKFQISLKHRKSVSVCLFDNISYTHTHISSIVLTII
jgi:hypothetical protein